MGVFLIFFANLHYLMLMGVIDSYSLFVPGAAIPVGDFTEVGSHMLGQSFLLAMQISAPFLVVGFVFYLGLGLLARLMPQVQVFFIIMPLQIVLGFLILAATLSAGMMWFLGHFEDHWSSIVAG